MRKQRTESNHRRTTSSKDGRFSPHIGKNVAERIERYCRQTNQNKTKFVEKCCMERLDVLEKDLLMNLSKEDLIEMIMGGAR